MATMYNFIVEINAGKALMDKLLRWANDELDDDDACVVVTADPDADTNWMGLIPAALSTLQMTPDTENTKGLVSRAFCDGAAIRNDTLFLCFHAADWCDELWDYLKDRYPDIDSIRVYVDEDYPDDVDELGEGDLYVFKRR